MKESTENKRVREVEITPALYAKVAARLADEVKDKNYFSGLLEIPDEEMECRLRVSAIIYRTPEGGIVDIVPVWWEFTTAVAGEELLNDFSFRYLRAILLD